jgi:co-chaperonin GroES (HSP10)
MKSRPLQDRVLVRPIEAVEKRAGGIITTEAAVAELQEDEPAGSSASGGGMGGMNFRGNLQ